MCSLVGCMEWQEQVSECTDELPIGYSIKENAAGLTQLVSFAAFSVYVEMI